MIIPYATIRAAYLQLRAAGVVLDLRHYRTTWILTYLLGRPPGPEAIVISGSTGLVIEQW